MMHLLRAASSGSHAAKPSLRTYNAAISALCRVGHLSRALRLEHEMVSFYLQLFSPCNLQLSSDQSQIDRQSYFCTSSVLCSK